MNSLKAENSLVQIMSWVAGSDFCSVLIGPLSMFVYVDYVTQCVSCVVFLYGLISGLCRANVCVFLYRSRFLGTYQVARSSGRTHPAKDPG